jgi:hypothetical protein
LKARLYRVDCLGPLKLLRDAENQLTYVGDHDLRIPIPYTKDEEVFHRHSFPTSRLLCDNNTITPQSLLKASTAPSRQKCNSAVTAAKASYVHPTPPLFIRSSPNKPPNRVHPPPSPPPSQPAASSTQSSSRSPSFSSCSSSQSSTCFPYTTANKTTTPPPSTCARNTRAIGSSLPHPSSTTCSS